MWDGKVIPDVEEVIWCRWRGAQNLNRRLCIERLLGADNQRGVPLWLICVWVLNLLRCACPNLHPLIKQMSHMLHRTG